MAQAKPPPSAAKEFGERVRARRKAMGFTQMGLGAATGVQFSFISAVERGVRNPTLGTMLRLADALDVDLAELVTGLHADPRQPQQDGPST